jgi:hypothetical protein
MGYRIKTRQYEEELTGCLSDYFYKISSKIETKGQCKIEVRNQWSPFKDEDQEVHQEVRQEVKLQDQKVHQEVHQEVRKYSPRIDIAVGPFAYGEIRYIEEYNKLSEASSQFINRLLSQFKENSKRYPFSKYIPNNHKELNGINENARCFLAIEIERTGTRKHRLGDIVNACAFGRIGIIIAWNDRVLKSFLAITEYLQFLKEKGKPTYGTRNLIIVTKEQFSSILKWQLKSSS